MNRCPNETVYGDHTYRCVLPEGHDGLHLSPFDVLEWGFVQAVEDK